MTTRSRFARPLGVLVAAMVLLAVTALTALPAHADGEAPAYTPPAYTPSSNYPAPPPPGHTSGNGDGSVTVVGKPTFLPVTGSDALLIGGIGVAVVASGAGLLFMSRRRMAAEAAA